MYTTIISAEKLKKIINEKNLIIFDCRFDLMNKDKGYSEYLESHIRGAQYINLESDLSSPASRHSGRHPLPDIRKFTNLLNSSGINNNSQIILYDNENSSMCSRLWWMLKLVGIENCAVLDGGFSAWNRNKFPVNNSVPDNTIEECLEYSYNSNYLVDTLSLKEMLSNKESLYLIDARDKERFLGRIEPLDKKAGHIPGAINMPFKNNLDEYGKFKEVSELKKNFSNINNKNSRDIVNMCGSGVTACHNFLAMKHCGLNNLKVYVGSWSAWSSYPDAEIEKE